MGWAAICFIKFGTEPKVFSLDLWIFRLEEARSSCPAEWRKHIDPWLIKCVGFSGTGGDRTLDQQAITLPSGRITHSWTGCMQKSKHSFVSSGLYRILSVLFSPSFLLASFSTFTSFCVCPTGDEFLPLFSHLSSPCCFLVLIDRFESLLRLTVFPFFSPSVSSSLHSELTEVWQLRIAAHYSSKSNWDDLMSQQTWPAGMRWSSLHCQSFPQQVLDLFP